MHIVISEIALCCLRKLEKAWRLKTNRGISASIRYKLTALRWDYRFWRIRGPQAGDANANTSLLHMQLRKRTD